MSSKGARKAVQTLKKKKPRARTDAKKATGGKRAGGKKSPKSKAKQSKEGKAAPPSEILYVSLVCREGEDDVKINVREDWARISTFCAKSIDKKYAAMKRFAKESDKPLSEIRKNYNMDIDIGVEEKIARLVFEFMRVRKGNKKLLTRAGIRFKTLEENVIEQDLWCAKWINQVAKNRKNLYTLLTAADALGIVALQKLCVTKLALMLKYAKTDDIDRVLDPAITDGKLLPMREFDDEDDEDEDEDESDGDDV